MTHDTLRAAAEAAPKVEDLLVWAVEDGVIRMSQVINADLQDALVKFAQRIAALSQEPPAAAPAQGEHTPNAKLLALADRIDHEKLWARRGLERPEWTQEQHDRCDAGVELRRYADLLGEKCWRVFPPKAGLSFRASTFDEVVKMARKEAVRLVALPHPPAEGSKTE